MTRPGRTRLLSRCLPHLASLTIVVVTLAVTMAIDAAWRSERAKEQRLLVTTEVNAARDRLERAVFTRVLLARNFVGYLENNPNFTDRDFRLLARGLVNQEAGILAVRLAKGNVVNHLYPFEGRVDLLGRRLEDTLPPDGQAAMQRLVRNAETLVTSPTDSARQHTVFLYLNPVYQTVVGLSGVRSLLGAWPYSNWTCSSCSTRPAIDPRRLAPHWPCAPGDAASGEPSSLGTSRDFRGTMSSSPT